MRIAAVTIMARLDLVCKDFCHLLSVSIFIYFRGVALLLGAKLIK
jgi:hypothetical protein